MNAILNAASITGQIGAGSIVLNDYALNITPIDSGYRLTVTRGSDTQTMDILDGVGIAGIEKTGSTGYVDSYRVTFTDGGTFDYTIETNAASNAAAEAARVEAENSREGAEAARASGGDAGGRCGIMVAIYVRWIRAGCMTLAQVPEKWREDVREKQDND